MMKTRILLMTRASFIAILSSICVFLPQASWAQQDCVKNPPNVANLVEIRPGFHRVTGPLAEFNPCHSSVELSMPGFFADKLAEKPTFKAMVCRHFYLP